MGGMGGMGGAYSRPAYGGGGYGSYGGAHNSPMSRYGGFGGGMGGAMGGYGTSYGGMGGYGNTYGMGGIGSGAYGQGDNIPAIFFLLRSFCFAEGLGLLEQLTARVIYPSTEITKACAVSKISKRDGRQEHFMQKAEPLSIYAPS